MTPSQRKATASFARRVARAYAEVGKLPDAEAAKRHEYKMLSTRQLLAKIRHLQSIQKQIPPLNPSSETIGLRLAPLFAEMARRTRYWPTHSNYA